MTAISNTYVNPYGNPQLDKQIAETMSSVQNQMSLFTGSTSSTNSTNSMTREEYLESRGCTDGNNDGKIGFFSAIGNILKGAVKSVVNTVKDIVTNPVKLLGAVATAALCVVFPPAGLALAGVGIATGAAKMIGGVANAMGAKTDAEAKAAWQQVGEGGVVLGTSIVGAKASVKSMSSLKSGLTNSNGKISLRKAFSKDTKYKVTQFDKNGTPKFNTDGTIATKELQGFTGFRKAIVADAKASPLGQKVSSFKNTLTSQADDIANTRLNTRMDELAKSGAKKLSSKDMKNVASSREPYAEAVNKAAKDLANASDDAARTAAKSKLEAAQKDLDDFNNSVEYTDLNTLKNAAKGGKNPVKATGRDYVEALKSKVPSKTKITLDNLDDIKGLSTTDKTYLRSALRQGQKINPDMLSKSGQVAYKEAVGSGAFQQAKAHGIEFFKNHGNDMLQAGKQVFPYEMSKGDVAQDYLQQYYV